MSALSPNRNLYLALLGLTLTCLLPMPARLTNWLSGVTWQLLIPATQPLTRVSQALRPQPGMFAENDPAVQALKSTIAELRSQTALLENENATLQIELQALRDLAEVLRPNEFRPRLVQRSGSAPTNQNGIFQVNAGSSQGVEIGTVVIVPPTQLAGIVTRVSSLTASVIPVTSPEFELLEVRIDRPELTFTDDPKGTLQPDENGVLVGLFATETIQTLNVAVGDQVRLDDPRIGIGHTGLLVGVIERIQPNDANPLHRWVFVRPTVDPQRQPAYYLLVRRRTRNSPTDTPNGGG